MSLFSCNNSKDIKHLKSYNHDIDYVIYNHDNISTAYVVTNKIHTTNDSVVLIVKDILKQVKLRHNIIPSLYVEFSKNELERSIIKNGIYSQLETPFEIEIIKNKDEKLKRKSSKNFRILKQFNRYGEHIDLNKKIKSHLLYPNSFGNVSTTYVIKDNVMYVKCIYKYRCKNKQLAEGTICGSYLIY